MIDKEAVLHTLKCNPSQYPQMLDEKFPHVLKNVVQLWETPDAEPYFSDLLQPISSGGRFNRDGFPEQAWQEILRLKLLYSRQHAH